MTIDMKLCYTLLNVQSIYSKYKLVAQNRHRQKAKYMSFTDEKDAIIILFLQAHISCICK